MRPTILSGTDLEEEINNREITSRISAVGVFVPFFYVCPLQNLNYTAEF